MPQRQSRPDTTSADAVPVAGGSAVSHPDRLYDLSVKMGGLERSVVYLEGQSEKTNSQLDKIAHEITAAKATFGTVKYLAIGILVGIWGLISALAIAAMVHYLHWGSAS